MVVGADLVSARGATTNVVMQRRIDAIRGLFILGDGRAHFAMWHVGWATGRHEIGPYNHSFVGWMTGRHENDPYNHSFVGWATGRHKIGPYNHSFVGWATGLQNIVNDGQGELCRHEHVLGARTVEGATGGAVVLAEARHTIAQTDASLDAPSL